MQHHRDEGRENGRRRTAAVIGAGPAGLFAAEQLARAGLAVTVFDQMPSAARKFLMAGRGGLNLTHSEPLEAFLSRYGKAREALAPAIEAFPPQALVAWAEDLGEPTFVGSSGRVFPKSLKASPLLRRWLARLTGLGVTFRLRHRWTGWDDAGALEFQNPQGRVRIAPDVTLLALGGASWPRLGSDGGWRAILARAGVEVAPFAPSNCGLEVNWSAAVRDRFAGTPLKRIAISHKDARVRGEAVATRRGLEGGAVYALTASIREALAAEGQTPITVDLRPDLSEEALAAKLSRPRGKQSLSNHLRKAARLAPLEQALLREATGGPGPSAPAEMARLIKQLPITVVGTAGLTRAISTAGGIGLDQIDQNFMLRARPGVFVAGEMLDWEAPTGGYLLQACFSTGGAAAQGALRWLAQGKTF